MPDMNPTGRGVQVMALALLASWMAFAVVFSTSHVLPRVESVREIIGAIQASWPLQIPPLVKAILGRILGLLLIPVILAVPYGAGGAVVRFAGLGGKAGGAAPYLRWALGLGLVTVLFHGLGLAGLLFKPVMGLLITGLALLGFKSAVRDWFWKVSEYIWKDSKVPLLGLGVMAFAVYNLTRLPITVEDSLIAHFAAPEMYLLEHKIFAEPQNFLWHMPLGFEMAVLPAWAFGGIEPGKMVNLGVLVALAGIIWGMARSFDAERRHAVGAWGTFWALSTGFIVAEAWQGKNDIMLALYIAGAVYCTFVAVAGKRVFWRGAGLLLGMAVAVKYSALLYAGALFLAVAVYAGIRRMSRGIVPVLVGATIPMLGWLVANWLYLGNPFHPFLYGIFSGFAWDSGLQTAWSNSARQVAAMSNGGKWGWLTSLPALLGGNAMAGSVALLTLLPLMVIRKVSGSYRFTGLVILFAALLWIPFREPARYLYPVLPLLGGMAGAIFAGRESSRRPVWYALFALVLAAFFLNCASLIGGAGWKYFAGVSTRAELMAESLGSWDSVRSWINTNVPARGRVLFVGEPRRLWMERRVLSYGPVYRPLIWKAVAESGDAAIVAKKMRQQGITHIVYNQIAAGYHAYAYFPGPAWTGRQLETAADFYRRYCRMARFPDRVEVWRGNYYVYEITPRPGRRQEPLFFIPEAEGRFNEVNRDIEAGKYGEAAQALAPAQGPVKGELFAEALAGRIDWFRGKYGEGVKELGPGVKAGLVTDLNLVDYGSCLANLGKYDEAIGVFKRADELIHTALTSSKLGISYYGRGWMRYRKGDYRGAIGDLEKAKELWKESNKPGEWLVKAREKLAR
jgi:hypothetical protein